MASAVGREEAAPFRGGQGISFGARAADGSGPRVFIKTLRPNRVRDLRARRRFKREVGAYETLADLGLPRLLDHNAETWEDRRTPMYMATELIDGVNLQTLVVTAPARRESSSFLTRRWYKGNY
jgi:eukaryotic-like serine/threonine-protein kinase